MWSLGKRHELRYAFVSFHVDEVRLGSMCGWDEQVRAGT